MAREQGLAIQLVLTVPAPSEIYTGLVFQMVCDSRSDPVVISRGGRYDALVHRCGAPEPQAFGAGFSFAIDPIRELLSNQERSADLETTVLVAFSQRSNLEQGLAQQRHWHQQGRCAVLELHALENRQQAEELAQSQGLQLDWIDP